MNSITNEYQAIKLLSEPLIKDLFVFIKSPSPSLQQHSIPTKDKVRNLLCLFVFSLVINIMVLAFAGILRDLTETGLVSARLKLTALQALILGGLIAPIAEESKYRLPLVYSKTNITLSLAILLADLVRAQYLTRMGLSSSGIWILTGLRVLLFLIFCLLIHIILTDFNLVNHKIQRLFSDNPKAIVYFYSFLFSLGHLTNYKYSSGLLVFGPLLILQKAFIGFILAYLRTKQGFIWSVILHIMFNIPAIIFGILKGIYKW